MDCVGLYLQTPVVVGVSELLLCCAITYKWVCLGPCVWGTGCVWGEFKCASRKKCVLGPAVFVRADVELGL